MGNPMMKQRILPDSPFVMLKHPEFTEADNLMLGMPIQARDSFLFMLPSFIYFDMDAYNRCIRLCPGLPDRQHLQQLKKLLHGQFDEIDILEQHQHYLNKTKVLFEYAKNHQNDFTARTLLYQALVQLILFHHYFNRLLPQEDIDQQIDKVNNLVFDNNLFVKNDVTESFENYLKTCLWGEFEPYPLAICQKHFSVGLQALNLPSPVLSDTTETSDSDSDSSVGSTAVHIDTRSWEDLEEGWIPLSQIKQ